MLIDLSHPIVASMMARPAKFADEHEMNDILSSVYLGDLNAGLEAATILATSFVKNYTGSFKYIVDMVPQMSVTNGVPRRHLKGVLNVVRREAISQRDGTSFTPSKFSGRKPGAFARPTTDTGLDISRVMSGAHSIPLPDGTTVIIHIEHPGTKSKWNGWSFISGGVDPITDQNMSKLSRPRLASQKPGETCKMSIDTTTPLYKALIDWLVHRAPLVNVPATPTPVVPAAYLNPKPTNVAPQPVPPATANKVAAQILQPIPAAKKEEPAAPATPVVESVRDRVRQHYGM